MKEYKAKYSHDEARKILEEIGAIFLEKSVQSDFYLKTKNANIFKLEKKDGRVYLMNLVYEGRGFIFNILECLDQEVSDKLLPLFEPGSLVLEKTKEHYSWKGSKIILDSVEKYGDFIELSPISEEAKEELFQTFGVKPENLIIKSYFDL